MALSSGSAEIASIPGVAIKQEEHEDNGVFTLGFNGEYPRELSSEMKAEKMEEGPAAVVDGTTEHETLIGTTDGFSWHVIPKEEPCNDRTELCSPNISGGISNEDTSALSRDINIRSNITELPPTPTTECAKQFFALTGCGKITPSASDLVKHMRTYTYEEPYCDKCQRTFTRKDSLAAHMRTHAGIRPYNCGTCQRTFSRKTSLVTHMRTHTGEKPYKCDTCQRAFTQKHSLVAHMRGHTGEKPYKCDTCQRAFTHKQSLVAHMRSHTGE